MANPLNQEEQKEKIAEYNQRHTFWSDQLLNQFGFSVNFFLTLGIGFIAFIISKRVDYPSLYINFYDNIDWPLLFYCIIAILTSLSIICGSISVVSRLYDLRLTRHVIWTRKRVMKKMKVFLPEAFVDLSGHSLVRNFIAILRDKIPFVTDKNFSNIDELKIQFNELRKQSKLLGKLSWNSHRLQILLLILAILIYGIAILIQ